MSDPVTLPAGPYASLSVAPSGPTGDGSPVVTVSLLDIEPVGQGTNVVVVDTNVTRAAAQRAVDFFTALLPNLPE